MLRKYTDRGNNELGHLLTSPLGTASAIFGPKPIVISNILTTGRALAIPGGLTKPSNFNPENSE